jgi:hypothetical protein
MYSRPRRLFQEIGRRTDTSWLRQPRTQMILVNEDQDKDKAFVPAALGEPVVLEEMMARSEWLQ